MTDTNPPGTLLYPRLPRDIGTALAYEQADLSLTELRSRGELSHQSAAPAPTGGTPADLNQIEKVQLAVRQVADVAGFPEPLAGREQTFDRPCGTVLFETMAIIPGDAAVEDVWTFLSLVVVPEIGPWRFPDRAEARILGRPRNVLRRLWWRAWALGPDLDWAPPECTPLGEDEFVGIMERPSVGGTPRTAKAVRDAIWRIEQRGVRNRSQAARDLTRRFRAFLSHICIDTLTDGELTALVEEASMAALGSATD